MTLKDTSVFIWPSVTGKAQNTNHNLKDMPGSHELLTVLVKYENKNKSNTEMQLQG